MAPRPGLRIPPRIQRVVHTRTGASTQLPLLPLAAACLLVVAGLQGAAWFFKEPTPVATPAQGWRTFTDRVAAQSEAPDMAPLVVQAPPLPQNVQFGDPAAAVIVTVFSDPSCGTCREQVRAWLGPLPTTGVRIVHKFWPRTPDRVTPGLLVELARRQGVVGDFWKKLNGASGDLPDAKLLALLEEAGIPLAQQRSAMVAEGRNGGGSLANALDTDMATARQANLPPPPVLLVDDLLVDGRVLQPGLLATYVQRRMDGQPVVAGDEFWLMRK